MKSILSGRQLGLCFVQFHLYIFNWPTDEHLEFWSFWTFWNHSVMYGFGFTDRKYCLIWIFSRQQVEVPCWILHVHWTGISHGRVRHAHQAILPDSTNGDSVRERVWIPGWLEIGFQVPFLLSQGSIRSTSPWASPQQAKPPGGEHTHTCV